MSKKREKSAGGVVILHPRDNVAVAIREIKEGEDLYLQKNDSRIQLRVRNRIPLGHKVSLTKIEKEKPVIKYGETIGKAIKDIGAGEHVHVHNLSDH